MRSELIYGAMTYVSNRYLLTRLAAHATRKLHRPNTRIEETTNDVLARFACANPITDRQDADDHLQPFPAAGQAAARSDDEDRK